MCGAKDFASLTADTSSFSRIEAIVHIVPVLPMVPNQTGRLVSLR